MPKAYTILKSGEVRLGSGKGALTLRADFNALAELEAAIEQETGREVADIADVMERLRSSRALRRAVQVLGGFGTPEEAGDAVQGAARAHGALALGRAVSAAVALALGADPKSLHDEPEPAEEGEA